MPPKADPYATALHRRIDALLLIITALIALVFFWGNITERHAASSEASNTPQTQISSK